MSYPAYLAFAQDPDVTFARWRVFQALQPPFLSFVTRQVVSVEAVSERARVSPRKAHRALRWLVRRTYLSVTGAGYVLAWHTGDQPPEVRVPLPDVAREPRPLSSRVYAMNRRARKCGATGRHSAADVQAKYDAQGGLCFYCSASLDGVFHVDHMTPLARGGTNDPGNLCCACPRCNLRKLARTAEEFFAARKSA